MPLRPETPAARLSSFLARYAPDIARRTRAILAGMRKRVPGAVELVYDNYNALVIGFGPTERTGDAPFSIAVYPQWVTLFFLKGARLPDPEGILKGAGSTVRHVVLSGPEDLGRPPIKALMAEAMRRTDPPFDPRAKRRLVVKSVSPKQRPRRPNARP